MYNEKERRNRQRVVSSQCIELSQTAPQPALSLTEDQLSFASAIVQQASRRIRDLRLLSAQEFSDTEIEAASHTFINQGRKSFLHVTRALLQLEKDNNDS